MATLLEQWLNVNVNEEPQESPEETIAGDEEANVSAEEENTATEPVEASDDEPEELKAEKEKPKAKPKGQSAILKALESVVKSIKKTATQKAGLPSGAVFEDGEWKYCCDGHRLLRTKHDIQVDDSSINAHDTVEKIFDLPISEMHEITCPELSALKSETAEVRKAYTQNRKFMRNMVVYTFDEEEADGFTLNTTYLIDAMRCTDSDTILIRKRNSPALMVSSDGMTEMIVLGIHRADGDGKTGVYAV